MEGIEKAIGYALEYVIVPVMGWVWLFARSTNGSLQRHEVELAVLRAQLSAEQLANERARSDMAITVSAIMAKLDSIEAALRK
jgi:hypothetical protein